MVDTVGCCLLERMGVSLVLADSSDSCARRTDGALIPHKSRPDVLTFFEQQSGFQIYLADLLRGKSVFTIANSCTIQASEKEEI
jgi:hypothetical protein